MARAKLPCGNCERKFKTEEGLDQHCLALHHYLHCPDCAREFLGRGSLESHQRLTKHAYCEKCDLIFRFEMDLIGHDSAFHPTPRVDSLNQLTATARRSCPCPSCGDVFIAQESLRAHQQRNGHSYCKACDRPFPHDRALADHRSAIHARPCAVCDSNSASREALKTYQGSTNQRFCEECERNRLRERVTQFRCCDCDRDFLNESALRQHLADYDHAAASRLDRTCKECERQFVDRSALSQHLSSVVHVPLCDIKCVGHKKCKQRFRCPSGLLHHLESGACRSGMNRQTLNRMVCGNDADRVITCDDIPAEAEARAIDLFPGGITLPTPDQRRPAIRVETKCPLCPARKAFRTLGALRDHLSSPVHAPKQFHCPSSLASSQDTTRKHFSTLSGLSQHLESGACEGGKATFQEAIVYVEEKLNQLGLGDLGLL